MVAAWISRQLLGWGLLAFLLGCSASRQQVATPPPLNLKAGGEQFQSYCAACHQYDGQGMGAAPPLVDSPWVTGPEERLIKIVLHGVRGAMEVHGETYDREMPGFGGILSDAEAASLLSFVRESFGAAGKPISASTVGRVRAASESRTDYWTVEELLTVP
jgi:mono/diheme cytochrome c family protein